MSKVYSFSEYDQHLCLKFSLELWLVILYFLRPFILLVSGIRMGPGAGNLEGTWGLKNMVYPDNFSLFIGISASIPTLFLIVAWVKRKPGAPDFIKKIWRNGVKILLISAAANVLIIFTPLFTVGNHKITIGGWVQLGVAIMIVWYLFSSQRVKDTFADFPSDDSDKASKEK